MKNIYFELLVISWKIWLYVHDGISQKIFGKNKLFQESILGVFAISKSKEFTLKLAMKINTTWNK